MQQGFPRYPGTIEELKAENESMKQELRKKGAQFPDHNVLHGVDADLVENIFLKNVMEYEKQIEKAKKIRIFDKIGRPARFKPPSDIPDDQIENAWKELVDYLHQYGIDLDACSPSVTTRELYRFAIEELFYKQMDDINVPGMITCFIYDEFYPDPVYDNTIGATDYCMRYILETEPLELMHRFRHENLWLNQYSSLTQAELKEKVNNYKKQFDQISIEKLASNDCIISQNRCVISGHYSVKTISSKEQAALSGNWRVFFEKNIEFNHWNIVGVEIEGMMI